MPYFSLCSLQHPAGGREAGRSNDTIEYLGIMLDSAALEARLPTDKLSNIKAALSSWMSRRQCFKEELLSLIGTLSFMAKVVRACRTFLRRMIDFSTKVPHRRDTIQLDDGFRLDLQWWAAFTTPWSGHSFFLLHHWTPAPDLHLFTDSSSEIGFGAYLHGEWFNGRWSSDQASRSIQCKELYPIVVAALVWGRRWTTLKVRFHCDNQVVVACLTSSSSHCPHLMYLLRNLFLHCASNNFTVPARHIPGVHNALADSHSRFQSSADSPHRPLTLLPPSQHLYHYG